jgi:hypothetical protein
VLFMFESIVTISRTLFKCSCSHANIIHDRARRRSIALGIRDRLKLTMLATDSLSQFRIMRLFWRDSPHMWHATTMANNSCQAMLNSGCPNCWLGSHLPWNYLPLKNPP